MRSCNVDFFALDPECTDVRYEHIVNPKESLPKPPVFLFGGLQSALSHLLFGQFHIGPVGVYSVAGGCISGHGTSFYKGTGLLSPLWNIGKNMIDMAVAESTVTDWNTPTRVIEGDVISLAGPGRTVWGHWLVDFLPRLYVLHLAGYNIHSARYILPNQAPQFATELLQLIGIPSSSLERYDERTELVCCSNLILPGYLRWGNRFSSIFQTAIGFLIKNIIERHSLPASPVQADRLFISRGAFNEQRTLTNRIEVEKLSADRSFTVIDPTSYSILEQISIFMSAKQVIGEYGSGLHNCIFSPKGTSVCAIRGSSYHPGFIQSGISDALQHDLGYVFGETPLDAWEQTYSVSIEDLERALDWMDIQMRIP